MCSSDADLSSCSVPSPMITRKRSKGSSLVFDDIQGKHVDGDASGDVGVELDSDDDFVEEKIQKRGRPSKNKKQKKSAKNKDFLKINFQDTSAPASTTYSPTVPSTSSSRPMVTLIPDDVFNIIEGGNLSTKPSSDYNCNFEVDRQVVIATPDQINSRSFDQEEFLTPNATNMKESIREKTMTSVETKLHPMASLSLSPCEESQAITTQPPPIINPQPVLSGVTSYQSVQHAQSLVPPVAGRGKHVRPVKTLRPIRPCLTRRPAPGTRPPLRPGAPVMLRLPGQRLPRSCFPPGGPRPRTAVGPRLSNVRSITPVQHHALPRPQFPSQYQTLPAVVEIDVSPPPSPTSEPNSVFNKLSSMGVTVAREKGPVTKHGWVLPPGLSVTKTSHRREEGPSLSLPSLAKALSQLGEGEGRKRLAQFKLTEEQVSALDTLGLREEQM
eukprot:GFUD01028245.1.p1 GENE.GFUD01028245.1~~GFUD01028245.1.p1  ORF type:complete len:441 (+),score=110.97 GFUD01028245.1:68-1390(+)